MARTISIFHIICLITQIGKEAGLGFADWYDAGRVAAETCPIPQSACTCLCVVFFVGELCW